MYTMWAIWAYYVHIANWMWKCLNSSTFVQCHKNIRVLNVNWIEEENKLKSKTEQIKSLCRSSGCTPLIKPLTILPNAFCAAVHENFMVSLYSLYVCSKRKCRSDKQKPDIHTFSSIDCVAIYPVLGARVRLISSFSFVWNPLLLSIQRQYNVRTIA